MTGVIVIGGHIQGLGIMRILGKLKIPVILMDSSSINLARHSKYCTEFIRYPKDKLLERLFELSKFKQYQGYILFPTNDLHVSVLSINKKQLLKHFIIASDDWSSVEKCYNKRITYQIAKELDMPIPKTWMPDSLTDLLSVKLNFPVIIKPAIMHTFYSRLKKKVFICNNQHELKKKYILALSVIPANEIIVQSIIPGGSEHLYSACFLFDGEQEIISFIGRRARQHPPDFGNATTFAQIVDNEELIKASKKFLQHIHYEGVCEIEYKFDVNEKNYKLLEINPRTWKWHSIAEKANVNLIENYYRLLLNLPIIKANTIIKASFRHLITDIPTLWKYKRKKLYKKYPHYPVKYAVWQKDDLLPGIFEIIYLPYFIIKK